MQGCLARGDGGAKVGRAFPKITVEDRCGLCYTRTLSPDSLLCPLEVADLGGEWPLGTFRAAALAKTLCQRLGRQLQGAIKNCKVSYIRQSQFCGYVICAFTKLGPVLGYCFSVTILKFSIFKWRTSYFYKLSSWSWCQWQVWPRNQGCVSFLGPLYHPSGVGQEAQ